jgi:hypothetical protein
VSKPRRIYRDAQGTPTRCVCGAFYAEPKIRNQQDLLLSGFAIVTGAHGEILAYVCGDDCEDLYDQDRSYYLYTGIRLPHPPTQSKKG